MEKLIATCGLDCAVCDARIATIKNDDNLRKETAEKWKIQHGAEGITPEMINCTGCREEGVKFNHCSNCEIRNCAQTKGFSTCANCEQLENCQTISPVLQFVPEALENLKSL